MRLVRRKRLYLCDGFVLRPDKRNSVLFLIHKTLFFVSPGRIFQQGLE